MLLLTADAARARDRATIDGGHAAGIELMRRAGRGVAEAIERRYGSLLGLRTLVLCGTGNNGGDGFVAGERLAARGAIVHVVLVGNRARVAGDAATALASWEAAAGAAVAAAIDEPALRAAVSCVPRWDLAVDALLGTGARGAPEGAIAAAVQCLRELDESGTRVVAVDVPTGVDGDTGAIARRAVRADLTVTFDAPKRGHVLWPGRAFAGTLEVVDIGLLPADEARAEFRVRIGGEAELAAWVPRRDPRAHKGTSGRVVVVGGSVGLGGAVALAARAATRSGAGYVQAAVPATLGPVLAATCLEQMAIACPETREGSLAAAAYDIVAAAAERAGALVVGSGLGSQAEARDVARRLVREIPRPMVVDADALNALEGRAEDLAGAAGARVLTPHVGEMSRLTGASAASLEARRVDAPAEWAARWNAVVVFKGAPTVTASPEGRTWVNATGGPALATAGTGDVLAGIIGALLAQGLEPERAAALGVHVHGAAGDRWAARHGVLGLAASDLHDELPDVLAALAARRDRDSHGDPHST